MAKTILVVDDELDILKVVTFRLKKLGHTILTSVDGQEALDLIRKEKPNLVLLDLAIPTINGYELCKRLRKDDALKDIPIIFLTASQTDRIEAKTKGFTADDYLIKPFEPEELLEKVRKYLKE